MQEVATFSKQFRRQKWGKGISKLCNVLKKKKKKLNSPDTEQEDKMFSSTVLENMAGLVPN